MRHKNHHSRLNRPTGHRRATLRNLACALINNERIETTAPKAKVLKSYVEQIVTLGKKGTVHHRRQAFAKLMDKKAVHKVFESLAPRYSERPGGYTRVMRTRRRLGDGAEMALIEFVDRVEATEQAETETASS